MIRRAASWLGVTCVAAIALAGSATSALAAPSIASVAPRGAQIGVSRRWFLKVSLLPDGPQSCGRRGGPDFDAEEIG